ncbi:MAG: adenosylcobalamin-dependent ribonucleoside-diphosphate reductase [Anaerolineae bacterium]
MNPWLAELVGYFIADGCLSTLNNKPGRFVFSVPHNTPDVENWLIGTFKRLGIKVGREQKPDDASSLVLARSITLARWWQKACLDKESSLYAEVPECIRTSSAESVRAFLRGLFEGDGDVSTYGQPHLSSTSLKLIEQVQQILLGLGIVSRFSIVERKGNSYGVNPCYVLRISHHDSVLKFATEIGFRSELKRRRLAERIDKASGLRSDPIPYAGALLSRYYRLPGRGSGPGKGHRSPYSALNRKIARYMRGERLPSRAQLLILAHQIEELRPMLDDELLRDDFIYARVTSVEKKRAYTMDIETLGEEFVANGFLVHNRRRGANMGILRVDHPDILDFITCKAQEGAFSNFNISVALTEKFMRALEEDGEYDLVNPRTGQVVKRLSARQVFDKIAEMAHRNGEPGIIFLDRMNEYNPTPALGEFESTNPCGEQILLPNESCNLGSINLSNMVRDGKIDWAKLEKVTKEAVHFMDNVITVNKFPLDVIREATLLTRKIGLGVMGFADMLIKLGVPYDSQGAEEIAEELMEAINYWSKEASVELALRRGSFPAFPESIYAEGRLPLPEREKRTPRYGAPHLDWEALQERIRREGIRNATTITIAPTGSISIIAGTSSGIEPIFALAYVRNILDHDRLPEINPLFEQVARQHGFYSEELMKHVAEKGTIRDIQEIPPEVRRLFVTAHDVSPEWHIRMQAVFQKHTDNACSKTINMPFEATVEDVRQAYLLAYRLGCKGLTIYRDRSRESQVWTKGTAEKAPQDEGQARHLWRLSRPRPRPAVTRGTTEKIRLGCNRTLYVTVNEDEMGLCEVFLQMGKSGGCTASQSEAIGRLISLALRSGIETEAIIRQLKGIRCPSPSWHNGGPTLSCSDAIAKAMERYLKERSGNFTPEKRAENPSGSEERMFLDICPECPECGAMMEMGEGCAVCRACGYSQCS